MYNRSLIPLLLIALGVSARLLPHPPNFAPIMAIALFCGIYLPKHWAILAPLAAMFLSDLMIGFYAWPIMLSVYMSFSLSGLVGVWIRQKTTPPKAGGPAQGGKNVRRIIGGTLLSSILFFLVTNWAVWAFGAMYPHTIGGLFESYTLAIPFFRNSLLGDFFYVGLMVGGYELALHRLSQRQPHFYV